MSSDEPRLPSGQPIIVFGPDANCTLALCPIEWSVYQYQPSLAANGFFLAFYALAGLIHIGLGVRWRTTWFMVCMLLGCLFEIIGYVGRILLHGNPFMFPGFMIQITFITTAPVFYTAAIYVTLSKTINFLAPELSRVKPKLLYWIFIPLDVVCLILQACGGALSTVSQGSSTTGVDIALAGLSLQVVSLFAFGVCFADYVIRYLRNANMPPLSRRMQLFLSALATAIVLIEARCFYRCYELSKGYQNSDLVTDEGLFIGLEGVLIALAVLALVVGHPGLVFSPKNSMASHAKPSPSDEESASASEYKQPT